MYRIKNNKIEELVLPFKHKGITYYNPYSKKIKEEGFIYERIIREGYPSLEFNQKAIEIITPSKEDYNIYITYNIESIPYTEEELKNIREKKYEEKADKYLRAYQGYVLEGDNIKASEMKTEYLKVKAAIRTKYSVPL